MANLFVISDTHFGHTNVLTFRMGDGSLLRPDFKDANHMDEVMIERWNSVVRPQDHAYHLGDVSMARRLLPVVRRLNGHKRLVFGNHDIYDYKEYAEAGFEKMMGMRVMDGLIFTHVPIHPNQLHRFRANIHGHTHDKLVRLDNGHVDERYINVCVEQVNYTPVALEDIKKRIK
jgi:calcineurin-like phosphoesterase family protein